MTVAILYRWKIVPGSEAAFAEAWQRLTRAYLLDGALGSRLHRGSDGCHYAYAQWPSLAARERAFASDGAPSEAVENMRATILERFPDVILEPLEDFLVPPSRILDTHPPPYAGPSSPARRDRVANPPSRPRRGGGDLESKPSSYR